LECIVLLGGGIASFSQGEEGAGRQSMELGAVVIGDRLGMNTAVRG